MKSISAGQQLAGVAPPGLSRDPVISKRLNDLPQLTQKQSDRLPGHYGGRTENRHSPPRPAGLRRWEEVKPQGSVPSAPSRGREVWEGEGGVGEEGGGGGRGAGRRVEDGKRSGKEEKDKVGMVGFPKLRVERR